MTPTLIEGEKKNPNNHPFITCFRFQHVRKKTGGKKWTKHAKITKIRRK